MRTALLLALSLLQINAVAAEEPAAPAVTAPAAGLEEATPLDPTSAAAPAAPGAQGAPPAAEGPTPPQTADAIAAPDAAKPSAAPEAEAAAPAKTGEAPAAEASAEPTAVESPAAEAAAAPTPQESPAAEPAVAEPAAAPSPEASADTSAGVPPDAAAAPAAEEAAVAPAAAEAAGAETPSEGTCVAGPGWECVRKKSPTRWGLTLDGGFPDALGVALLYRPWYWLRFEAGGTTTVYASHGVRAGVSLVPFHFPVTPALTVNYGRVFESDWNPMLEKLGSPNPDLEPVLRKFGYQYVDAHVGLEIGAPRRFVLFVRAGLTQIWTELHGLTAAAASQITDATMSATIADTRLTARVPSAKVGFLIYLF